MKITPDLFEAFLKCPTKCWLRVVGEPTSGNAYAEWVQAQNESYRAEAAKRLTADLPADECDSPGSGRREAHYSAETLKTAKWRFALDVPACTELGSSRGPQFAERTSPDGQQLGGGFGKPNETQMSPPENSHSLTSAATIENCLHAVERIPSAGRGQPAQFIPIRFIYRNKLTKDDKLLLVFDAFVVSEMLGRAVSLGKIIHGDDHATLKVKTSALAGEVRKRLGRITALLASPAPPDLVLNRHCAECEFQARCRKLAVEKDDLSLLASMSAKERQKLRSKGIFTVTQLSYTFRPRRRPRRQRDKREKYHHALKALAIREQKIHIVGSPELKLAGTPVYLDVEGLPDRDFYYLIGVRIGQDDSAVQHSLWADTVADEGKIWREFLALLETVEQPVLIHYGSYETTFLKEMNKRHGKPPDESVVAKAFGSAFNLISVMFAKIYFPTCSNRLKELASFVGAHWALPETTGLQAIAWRHQWEVSGNAEIKAKLLGYNRDDCAALMILATEVQNVIATSKSRVDVDFADAPKNLMTNRAAEIYRAFNQVRLSAHFDYSQSRIKMATADSPQIGANPKKLKSRPAKRPVLPAVKGRIIHVPRKRKCERHPDHPCLLVPTKKPAERALVDIAFTKIGCKKTMLRYIGKRGRCLHCGQVYVPPAFKQVKNQIYGPGFSIWIVYLRMALRLSYRLIAQATSELFGTDLSLQQVEQCVDRCAENYALTEKLLLEQILKSPAIHVDETKLSILGSQQFVWVLTNGKHVIFRLTEGRETGFLKPLLTDYAGTLVSDFYGGYDALPVRQQKCLVHLIRDLNDDLWKNPFNFEYEEFVASVRDLLLPILSDTQRFGLKAFHLRKHRQRVDAFYRKTIDEQATGNEIILTYQKRFVRYRKSLFVFLERDGIPWNNNVAERALRHLAVQRKISGAFSSRGAQNYIRLLGLAQSCKFQNKSFLGFLRSGLQDVDAYKEARRRRRRPPSAIQATISPQSKMADKQSF